MTAAMRVANAVAEARLKVAATLIASGVAEGDLVFGNMADVCCLDVRGETAVSFVPTWEPLDGCYDRPEYEGDGTVIIDVLWSPPWAHLAPSDIPPPAFVGVLS